MAGRPSKYESHVKPKLLLIGAWARDGLTDADICKNLDVSQDSFIQYKKEYPELIESLKRNKEEADIIIENELYEKAKGKIMSLNKVKVLNDGTLIPYEEEVYIPGDTTAQIFWLKNRKPQAWRDKQEIDHSGKLALDVDIEGMNDDEILNGITEALQAINALSSRIGTKA